MTQAHCIIRQFAERDIDLWLAEELRVNAKFAEWFVSRALPVNGRQFPAVSCRISAHAESGETDVEAVFRSSAGVLAILVENKIEHTISKDQIDRYVLRGQDGVDTNAWHDFRIVLFAPSRTLVRYQGLLKDVCCISFEDTADFLSPIAADARSIYRAEFIRLAALKPEIDKVAHDARRVADGFYDLVEADFPNYFLSGKGKYPKTRFIALNCPDFPKYLRLDLKGHMGEVILASPQLELGN